MNDRSASLSVSLAFHGMVLLLIYTLNSSFASPPHPILIDFSLADRDSSTPDNAGQSTPAVRSAARPAASIPQPVEKQIPQLPPATPLRELAKQPIASPALEPTGPVAVSASPALPSQVAPGNSDRATAVSTAWASGSGSQGKPGGSGSGSGSGSAGGADQAHEQLRGKYRAEHFVYIKKIIQESITYPAQGRRMQWSGVCRISFVVLENGQVSDIRILKSTGHALLDDNVVETIKKVAPFPRPPVSVKLLIPFTYNIN